MVSRGERGVVFAFSTLEQLFERSSRAVQIVDRAGLTRYANRAFLTLLGPALDPQTPEFDLHAAGPVELLDAVDTALAGISTTVGALALPWARGALGRATVVLTPLHGDAGAITGVILQYEPTVDVEHLFLQVTESKAQLDAAINSIQEGVILLDQLGRIILVNPFVHEIYGVARGRLLGLRPHDLAEVLGADFPDGRALVAALPPLDDYDPEEEWSREYQLLQPRARIVRHDTSPIYDEAGGFLGQVMLIHDITTEHAALRARDELLSVASHELRTPLTAVKGFAQLLKRDLSSMGESAPRRMGQHLGSILRQIDRLTRLVDELLEVSRIETGRLEAHRERCDLAAITNDVFERLSQDAAARGCTLTLRPPAGGAAGYWDPDLLDQVITNLLDNAIRYSPQGGAITVTITADGANARLAVADQGIGIPEEQLTTIFEPFTHGKNVRRGYLDGFGLGLYIALRLIERNGGQIWAESIEGQGSTFWLNLPQDHEHPTAAVRS
jgi:PAS domain S-box-containing protein